ncbi:MAG: D-glycero-beta-D-manno-heptose 1,7-bisphosphate 7-phosphatase [Elusimicrobiota bacterium]|nr:D-glycero-beta-D-manno-heptose 1,7-bisphosphate 7-phosphatase [Elusimicrobiota bacterium]
MKVVFLDRDGVINKDLIGDYVKSWEEFKFLPRSLEAIRKLTENGYKIIIISNQAGINKGIIDKKNFSEINRKMIREIRQAGGKITKIYYCPHRPDENCSCRKPKPGLFLKAKKDFKLNFASCYLVGDKIADVIAGKSVGCKTILVKTGFGRIELKNRDIAQIQPDYIANNLFDAVNWILKNEGSQNSILNRMKSSHLKNL